MCIGFTSFFIYILGTCGIIAKKPDEQFDIHLALSNAEVKNPENRVWFIWFLGIPKDCSFQCRDLKINCNKFSIHF